MPVGTTTDSLLERVKQSFDLHSKWEWESFLSDGIDAHFHGRVVEFDSTQREVSASSLWWQLDKVLPYEGGVILPRDKRTSAIYTRMAFRYPHVTANIKYPAPRRLGNETWIDYYVGLETGCAAYGGILSYKRDHTGTFSAVIGNMNGLTSVNMTKALPSDADTAYHTYRIIATRNKALFLIDSRLRLVVLYSLQGGYVKLAENTLPYSIALVPPLPSRFSGLLEFNCNRTATATNELVLPVSPFRFRVNEGSETYPLELPLYVLNTDTTLAGYSISSGSATSHPVPTSGYSSKTLYFMADQAGTLNIEVYTLTGNWRTYDSVSVSANTLVKYRITDPAVLARVTFTPSTYPTKVLEAEASLQ
jgi:hypothetical protein